MNKITPEVRNNIDTFSNTLEMYFKFFGKLPDLADKEDRGELFCIYTDLKYMQENIKDRQERKIKAE